MGIFFIYNPLFISIFLLILRLKSKLYWETIFKYKQKQVTMEKIKSFADLKKKREELQSTLKLREMGDNVDNEIQVKVAMATCGIAAGAKQVMETIITESENRNLPVVVMQTGCMGFCDAEPTVEVKKPGQEPVVFGKITPAKAVELVEKYLAGNELLDCVIPVTNEK